ncbi:MAG: hypothetical protein WC307_06375 [Candidatus Nanoarchaeia archaeon]|jgi:hypothetical protein
MNVQLSDVYGKNFTKVNSNGSADVNIVNSLVPDSYDYMSFGYTGDNITDIVYKIGGASGTIVATLTLTWSGSNITSVART